MNKEDSLFQLLPYLSNMGAKITLGAVMVCCTVVASMFSPWVMKYVVDDLRMAFSKEKLPIYAALILEYPRLKASFVFSGCGGF